MRKNTLTGIAVTTSLATIATIDVSQGSYLYMQVTNTGSTNDFDQFKVERRVNPDGDWEILANTAANFVSLLNGGSMSEPLEEVQGTPCSLAATEGAYIRMRVEATSEVQISAACEADTTTAAIYIGVQ